MSSNFPGGGAPRELEAEGGSPLNENGRDLQVPAAFQALADLLFAYWAGAESASMVLSSRAA